MTTCNACTSKGGNRLSTGPHSGWRQVRHGGYQYNTPTKTRTRSKTSKTRSKTRKTRSKTRKTRSKTRKTRTRKN